MTYHPLVSKVESSAGKSAFVYLFMFITITLIQHLSVAYETFYIVEHASSSLFLIKVFEFALFYIIVAMSKHMYPVTTLASIVLLQIISFTLLAINAYTKWQIKPYFKVKPAFIIKTFLLGLLTWLLIYLF